MPQTAVLEGAWQGRPGAPALALLWLLEPATSRILSVPVPALLAQDQVLVLPL